MYPAHVIHTRLAANTQCWVFPQTKLQTVLYTRMQPHAHTHTHTHTHTLQERGVCGSEGCHLNIGWAVILIPHWYSYSKGTQPYKSKTYDGFSRRYNRRTDRPVLSSPCSLRDTHTHTHTHKKRIPIHTNPTRVWVLQDQTLVMEQGST